MSISMILQGGAQMRISLIAPRKPALSCADADPFGVVMVMDLLETILERR